MTPTLESITELIKDSMYKGHGQVMQELRELKSELNKKIDDMSESVESVILQNAAASEWRIHVDNKILRMQEVDKDQYAKIEETRSFQWKVIGFSSAVALAIPVSYILIEKAFALFT